MAGIVYPRQQPRATQSRAEVTVWKALGKHLPDGWVAWHSLRLRVNAGWEGEGDFVIANPRRGLLVLEVKGGHIELQDGRWLQNGRPMAPPRDQAHTFTDNLIRRLRRDGTPPPAYGIACAFPDMDFFEGPENGDLQGLVLGGGHLRWLGESLPPVFDKVVPVRPLPPDTRWIDRLHALWGETWVPQVKLRDRVEEAALRCVSLDREQLVMLEMAGENERALVEGKAGSGKTVIAREICFRRAKAGKRVLYLCFTDALAQALGDSLARELGEGAPKAISVRRLAQHIAGGEPDDNPEWLQVLSQASRALKQKPADYDFVVVDEAQDLEPEDWAFVAALVGDGGLWVFRDARQRFWTDRGVPDSLFEGGYSQLSLLKQKRNPPAVAALAESYIDGDLERLTRGDDEVRVVVQDGDFEAALAAQLDRLAELGVAPGEMAVLSAAGQTRSELLHLERAGDHVLRRADAPDADAHVVADTFLRFKGLERPFVILVEPQLALGERYETRLHIAVTRATGSLVVLCPPEAVAADERFARLA